MEENKFVALCLKRLLTTDLLDCGIGLQYGHLVRHVNAVDDLEMWTDDYISVKFLDYNCCWDVERSQLHYS